MCIYIIRIITYCLHIRIAGQTWNLAIHLPLIIGDKIPENDLEWECFLVLLDILQICLTRILSVDLISYLQVLIELYLNSFCHCYPHASIIPKQHYMVHFPTQIIKYIRVCMYLCVITYITESNGL